VAKPRPVGVTLANAMVPATAGVGRGVLLGDAASEGEAAARPGTADGEVDVVPESPQAFTTALAHSSRTTSATVQVAAAERRCLGCVASMSPPRVGWKHLPIHTDRARGAFLRRGRWTPMVGRGKGVPGGRVRREAETWEAAEKIDTGLRAALAG
jgi:hypothetical protein